MGVATFEWWTMGIWCRTAGTIQCTAAPPRRGCPEGVPPSDEVGTGLPPDHGPPR
jgi:hypothetical protein